MHLKLVSNAYNSFITYTVYIKFKKLKQATKVLLFNLLWSFYSLVIKKQNVDSASGKAIPLCLPNDYEWDGKSNTCTKKSGEVKRDSLVIVPEAVEILERITNPISVVAIAGPSRTGKSYLLNQLIPSKQREGSRFQITNTLDPVTMGIWMWDTPFVHTLENEKEATVILLDTES